MTSADYENEREYDTAEPGMQDAVEKAREMAHPEADGWDSVLEKMRQTWEEPESETPPPPKEETPTKATGDAPADQPPAATGPAEAPTPKDEPQDEWAAIANALKENDTRPPAADPLEAKMAAVGWRPKESASTVDWEGLQSQLQAAERAKDTTQAVGAILSGAGTGEHFRAPPNAGEGAVAAAKAPLEIEKTRLEAEAKQRQAHQDLLEQARKAELNDPSSAVSKRAQEAYAKQFGGDSRLMPAGLNQMSANEIAGLTHTAIPLTSQKSAADLAKSRLDAIAEENRKKAEAKDTDDAAKAAEAKRKLDEEHASVESQRALLLKDPNASKLGFTPELINKLDRRGIEDAMKRLDDFKMKGGGGTGKPVHITAGDINSVPERRPGYRDLVKGIADNRIEAPKAGARFGAELISDVMAYKPNFDATKFGNYAAVAKQQATAPDVVAMDVARHHLALAEKLIPDNADANFINRMKQSYAQGSGDPEFTNFNTAATVSAHEVARVMKIDDQKGKEVVEHMMAPAQSKAQLIGVFRTIDQLVSGKQEGLNTQLARVAPPGTVLPSTHGSHEPLQTRKQKNGQPAYKARSGADRWFSTPEEAEAH